MVSIVIPKLSAGRGDYEWLPDGVRYFSEKLAMRVRLVDDVNARTRDCIVPNASDYWARRIKESMCSACDGNERVEIEKVDEININEVNINGDMWVTVVPRERCFCRVFELYDKEGLVTRVEYCPRNRVLIVPPVLTVASAEKLIEVIHEFNVLEKLGVELGASGRESEYDILIGTDFEAVIYRGLSVVDVDAIGYSSLTEEIGRDGGSSYTLEMRPRPEKSEIELVKKIEALLRRVCLEDDMVLSAYSDIHPLGFHVHVSVWRSGREIYLGREFMDIFCELMYRAVGEELRGLNRGLYSARYSNGYGGYTVNNYRIQADNWIEYREFPSYVLVSPELTRIVLKLARKTMEFMLCNAGREVRFSDNVELMKMIGMDGFEIEFLLDMLRRPREEVVYRDVRELWGINISGGVKVMFRDYWCEECLREVMKVLETVQENVKVILFGLREDRGDVVYSNDNSLAQMIAEECGLEVTNYDIPSKYKVQQGIIVGVPRKARVSNGVGMVRRIAECIRRRLVE